MPEPDLRHLPMTTQRKPDAEAQRREAARQAERTRQDAALGKAIKRMIPGT
jgi:hypothetical protein